uniref:Caspase 20, apoptosis-related cysteine peptidase n=1 Tax=Maylandia zebra TaxID=106582 RepID=A0A3P9C6Z3_9CICH
TDRYGASKEERTFCDGSQRRGTDKDAQMLMCEDLNKDQMDQVLEHGDAFICSILSHGKKGVVLGTDRNPLPIKEITRKFRGCDQSVLIGKPKVFLIQACQGSNIQRGVQMNDIEIDDDTSPLTIPEEADVLVAMATVEDHASLRHIVDGSWFVQSLCEQLKERCPRGEDIVSILHYVNDDVAHRETTSLITKRIHGTSGPVLFQMDCGQCFHIVILLSKRHRVKALDSKRKGPLF